MEVNFLLTRGSLLSEPRIFKCYFKMKSRSWCCLKGSQKCLQLVAFSSLNYIQ